MSQPRPNYEAPTPRLKLPRREVLACLVIVFVLATILYPVFRQAQYMARQVSCLAQLRMRGQSVRQYALDHKNTFPPASSWQTRTFLYKDADTPGCPAVRQRPEVLGYAMDGRLSERSLSQIGAPHEKRVLLYESSNLIFNANDPGISFAARHQYGIITFVDGHAKMYKQDQGELVVRKGTVSP